MVYCRGGGPGQKSSKFRMQQKNGRKQTTPLNGKWTQTDGWPIERRTLGPSMGERGGGGVWDPKVCVPKMARPDFAGCKFRFPPMVTLVWGGGGGFPSCGCPPV